AELHAVLASPSDAPDFTPEEAVEGDAVAWSKTVQAQLDAAYAVLAGRTGWPDDDSREAAAALDRWRGALNAAIGRLAASAPGALKTRTHGDFHLGQVLVTSGDAYIIDFEGEPARPLAERRAKTSPLRDLAGVLRSFDYAVAVASGRAQHTAQPTPGHDTVLDRFVADASQALLAAYRAAHGESPRRWVAEDREPALLDLFLLEKAAYEVCYEAANRPAWIGIPLRGLMAIAARVTDGAIEPTDA
ncbi:MAG: alpha-amylase, partial [Stellaceae bacterium]